MGKSPSEQQPGSPPARRASRARGSSTPEEARATGDSDSGEVAAAEAELEAPQARPVARSRQADAEPSDGAAKAQSRAIAVTPRFRIFIIDSGWNSVAGKVLRDNLALFNDLTPDHPTYLVDRATSIRLLRRHQEFVGCDPIISVHDLKAFERRRRGDVYGVRAHLGLLRDEKAVISLMQLLAGFLSRYRDSEEFEAGVRSELRLEGLQGAIEIVMGAMEHKELIA